MKKPTVIALGVALALGLSACGESNNQTQTQVEQTVSLKSGLTLANFDQSIRPQDDFFNYVNGTWLKNFEIPADKSNYGSFTVLADGADKAIKKIIEQASANKSASGEQKLIGDFYNAYMDTDKVETLGVSPVKPYLAEIDAAKDHKALSALMGKLLLDGAGIPFGFYVNNDKKNSAENAVYFYQSGLGLPDRDYYLEDNDKFTKIRGQYVDYITALLTKAGVSDAAAAAKNILALETEIARIQWTRVQSRDANKTYNKKNDAEMAALFGEFDWNGYKNAVGLSKLQESIVMQPEYFEGFGKLFGKTDAKVWQQYLSFHFVSEFASLMSADVADLNFNFYGKTLRGLEAQKPRWKRAVGGANSVLGEALGKLYVEQNFKPEAKARMKVLVDNLIKAYGQSIEELEWMSPETKLAAKEKLSKFTPKIGYPDKWKDYSSLEIKADDLVGNYVRYSHFAYEDMLSKIGQPVDRSEWHMNPQTVNAYFNPVNNEIVFPAAILQPPFFNMEAEDAVNYGGIGAVIGHELGHGFDDQGAKYDGDGNLRNWWTENDLSEFQTRGKQLSDQYSAYAPFEDAHVNGDLTLGENIGDLGGLTVAYKAYQLSLNGKPSPVIDGFNGEQRVFLGWGQIWQRKYREEELRTRLKTDPHSPSQYRVIGILSNMPDFYTAFDVKEGDGMYIKPEQRVKIW